ncbi:hypothetical protein [Streptomyces sp. NPDC029041]|uniref:hypothetical protein n=1 Tax=Streptomyces sp. NPDC029041 TaxID=3155727 RepID=UPI0033E1754D
MNVSALLALLLFGDQLATHVAGQLPWGLVLVACQAFTVLVSVVWYDRACAALGDRYADELRAVAGTFSSGSVVRP